MRILVFSDSHGNTGMMRNAIADHPEADMIIHLGDGERDIESLKYLIGDKKLVQVCGNCDFGSLLPVNEIVNAGDVKIFCSHGHIEQVKYGNQILAEKAKSIGARITLYGHTHVSVTDYDDGFYLMNPGSIRMGEYGIIDIVREGIMLIKAEV